MSKLKITKRENKDVIILDLSGKVQIGESSTELRTSLRGLVQEGEKNILLNLAEVISDRFFRFGRICWRFGICKKKWRRNQTT